MPRGRDEAPRSTGSLVLSALVGLGALATLLSVREERQSVHLADRRAADLAAAQLQGALENVVGSLRGADGLAVTGSVDPARFQAFATDILSGSLMQSVAYAQVVTADTRAEFQATTGLTIRDTDGHGGFRPGTPRDRSIVVAMVSPLTPATSPVLGFDLASDPVRLAAAEASERARAPVVSGRISTATQAKTGVAVIDAVRDPAGATVGFLSSGLDIEVVVTRAGIDGRGLRGFALGMDGATLTGTATGGATQAFTVAGHQFVVTVRTNKGFDSLVPLVIGFGTVALAVTVMAAAGRDRRQREHISRAGRRSKAIAGLGQALSATDDPTTVVDEVLQRAAGIMDANHVTVALRTPERPTRLYVRHHDSAPGEVARRPTDVGVDDELPLATCVREEAPLVLPDAAAVGAASVIAVPLTFGGDLCVGAIGFEWTEPMSAAQAEERQVAAETVAELMSRSLERAVVSVAVRTGADNLGLLSRALAGSHSPRDVQRAVSAHAANVLAARVAELQLDDAEPPEGIDAIDRVIVDRAGTPIGRLVLGWRQVPLLGPAQLAVLDTMVEMIGQTLERTALTEQEHQLIVQFQRALLRAPVAVDGLDIAVQYRPAMNVVGLGGDFYDVVPVSRTSVFIVIGDVTGHGSEAVATMAELKSVIHGLLRGGTTLEAVCTEVDLMLARRGMYATAQIAEIDPVNHRATLINAGHPWPVLSRADGATELLTGGHRPLLGLATPAELFAASEPFSFGVDDLLILYTDGLIEQRTQPIDIGMHRLSDAVGECGHGRRAEDVLDHVVDRSDAGRAADRTDDDMAVIAVRCLA